MNMRNRYLLITIRTLLGLLFLFSGVTGLLAGPSAQGIPPPMVPATQSLWAMGIFQMIKVTEIVAGLMLISGFLPALATIFIAPLAVGIIVFNARIAPSYLPMGIVVCLFTAYLGYAYWDKYKALFTRN
jgi:uncharacterized membrane protein YphA (DoxX/SURF4 family)